MPGKLSSWLTVGCLALLALSSSALANDFSQYQLKSLRQSEAVTLANVAEQYSAVMLFEPHCSWCIKQARALAELQQRCPQIQPIALGINGDRLALKRALFNLQVPFDAYIAPFNLLHDMGGVHSTPITLFFKHQQLVDAVRGYQSAEALQQKTGC